MKISNSEIHEDAHFCYESSNTSCRKDVYPTTIWVSAFVVLGTTILLTVFGNLLVISAIVCSKQLHTPTNYLILSLAVADFLLGSVVMPPSMVRSLETCWYFGNLFCKIHSSADFCLCHASILHMSLISIDRYLAVCQPLHYHSRVTNCVVVTMVIISWIVSVTFGFGIVFLKLNTWGTEEFYYKNFYCEGSCFIVQSKVSNVISSFLSFYAPGLLIVMIYLRVFIIARKQVYTNQSRVDPSNSYGKNLNSSRKSDRKATRTLGIVIGIFMSCWTPYFVCHFANSVFGYETPLLLDVFVWIGYSNSGWNPIIYAFFYKWFRKSFVSIFCNRSNYNK